jgi:endonuclease YncB( thermonuclease family)
VAYPAGIIFFKMTRRFVLGVTIIMLFQCTVLHHNITPPPPPRITLYSLTYDPRCKDPCGDPTRDSNFYLLYEAKVNRVSDSFAIEITGRPLFKTKITFDIELAGICFDGISSEQKIKIKHIIESLILKKKVAIYSNCGDIQHYNIVEIDGEISLNYSLLRNGLGKFCMHRWNELDFWRKCRYKQAEQAAIKEKLGIWKDAGHRPLMSTIYCSPSPALPGFE